MKTKKNYLYKKPQRLTGCLLLSLCLLSFLLPFSLLSSFFFSPPSIFSKPVTAKANAYTTYVYARVESDDVYLYKTNSTSPSSNIYFAVPKTYFVLLLSNLDDDFYKAQYRDVEGFVLKDAVCPVAETPEKPYLENVTFRVYTSDGTDMLSLPQSDANVIDSVEVLQEIDYYGVTIGEQLIDGRGYEWYYGKNPNTNKQGYFYKGLCDSLSEIPNNTEIVSYTSSPFNDDDNSYLYNLIDLSTGLKVVLIALVCLPSLVLVYLMFKPFSIEKQKLKANKKVKNKTQEINKIQKIIDDETL